MTEKTLYFGYGVTREPQMIAAILGKSETELIGIPATLEGYNLVIQRLDQVPDAINHNAPIPISPRTILKGSWGNDYVSYEIRQGPEGNVSGMVWELTPDERERIKDWELNVFGWHEECKGRAFDAEGNAIIVITERIGSGQAYDHEVDGMNYETWLDAPEKFIVVAEKARREYDERLYGPEGNISTKEFKNV